MGDFVLFLDDYDFSSAISYCRICHEAEFESVRSLEAPCACSGTLKFAHRDCIQRWCDEKGDTICEICLQNYEPGYTSPPKKLQRPDTGLTIRDSLQFPRTEQAPEILGSSLALAQGIPIGQEYTQCSYEANRSASFCRSLALIFTILLLLRHLVDVLVFGTEDYPFTLMTVLLLRASGILFPMYILTRLIASVHHNIHGHHQYYQDSDGDESQLTAV